MKRWGNYMTGLTAAAALGAAVAQTSAPPSPALHDPYQRPKNGPPLQNVFHKVKPVWLFQKLAQPKHHPAARMPDFKFSQEEVLDIMAYLRSIGDPSAPAPVSWPAWAAKKFDDLSDEESEAVFALADEGKKVWSNARCSICHTIHGPGGSLIGGYVDLRVGGIDLQIAGAKLQRDWLYRWLREPKEYFPDTLMPRFRFSEGEIKALTEYILRDEVFRPASPEAEEPRAFGGVLTLENQERISRGKRLMILSRCVLCHDIKGIPELLPPSARPQAPPPGSFEFLACDARCLSCHSFAGQGGTYAPELASEGSRLNKDWLVRYLQAPDIIRPLSQQMPKFNLAEEEAATVAAFMEKNGRDARIPENIPGGPVTSAELQRGRELYKAKGCFACHSIGEGAGGVVGPALEGVGTRLQPGYIWYHLKHPHAINPYSAEPDYRLTDEEARVLAAYLSTKKP
ncbi:MAG: cytochrome c [Chloroflexi bacterium]|nr:cytochrome c [Chloroflexota bacterium]